MNDSNALRGVILCVLFLGWLGSVSLFVASVYVGLRYHTTDWSGAFILGGVLSVVLGMLLWRVCRVGEDRS